MTTLQLQDLTPHFGSDVVGFDPRAAYTDDLRRTLQAAFDQRGLLRFRGIELSNDDQARLCQMLIRREGLHDGEPLREFFVSNRQADSGAPYGRLRFHSDTMWAEEPMQVLSLYAVEVEPPTTPTLFVSATHAWTTLPEPLRGRVEGTTLLQTAGDIRRGDLSDVLLTEVRRPPSTTTSLPYLHPRTGGPVLYACEQMTSGFVGVPPDESEALLEELFDHMYRPEVRWEQDWRLHDLVVWDNVALQHARSNVVFDGPARVLRKYSSPMPRQLAPDEMPVFSTAD